MILFQFLILTFLILWTISFPICNLSIWSHTNCTGSIDTIYSDLIYDGNCTMFPNDPDWTTYKLSIDIQMKTVQHFLAYNFKNCYSGNELFSTKIPLLLDICAPLILIIGPGQNVTTGSLSFHCHN